MRKFYVATMLVLLAGPAGARGESGAALLRPLSDTDELKIQEMGCESAFTVGPRTYVFAKNNRMVVRTAAGLAVCNIDNRIIDAFMDEGKPLTCGGVNLQLRHTARHKANLESDSVSGPARLTIIRDRARQILQGESGTAC